MNETFISHLIELRNRLVRTFIALGLVFLFLFPLAGDLYALLAQPLLAELPKGGQMIATDVITPFLVPLKVALMAAFMIVLPYILYQAWAFIAPGLYVHEKRLALPLVVISTLLFLCGMAFAYFLVLPAVFFFVISVAPEGVAVMTDINKYLDFVLTMFIVFGLAFETPVVVVVLVKMGIVSIAKLKEARPYVGVGVTVIGAIFTPPDVASQLVLASLLYVLYELGIFVAGFIGTAPAKAEGKSDYQPLSDAEMERELDKAEAGSKEK